MGYCRLNVAAKIMEKYGYKKGSGLGKDQQGMSTALQVTKTGLREGKIIQESMAKDEESASTEDPTRSVTPPTLPKSDPEGFVMPKLPASVLAAVAAHSGGGGSQAGGTQQTPESSNEPAPITEVLKNPSKLVLLKNMVGSGEVDNELEPEVREEMAKYGEVTNCLIYEMPAPVPADEAVRIFVEFFKVDQAIKG